MQHLSLLPAERRIRDGWGEGTVQGRLLFSVLLGYHFFLPHHAANPSLHHHLPLLTYCSALLPQTVSVAHWSHPELRPFHVTISVNDLSVFMEEDHWPSSPKYLEHGLLVACLSMLDC